MDRRTWLKSMGVTAAAAGGVSSLFNPRDVQAIENNVKRASEPSKLEITDMRIVRVGPAGGFRRFVIRLDTNQGISGYGEVRDGSSSTYALMLKNRIIGENPCNVDKIFRKIKQFGGHARQAGGVVSIEMACMDLAGKAWGVPCYQMLGGKFRDKIRVYTDTVTSHDPKEMGQHLKERMDMGYTFLKMDVGMPMLRGHDQAVSAPEGMTRTQTVMHPFTSIRITKKGLDVFREYVGTVRDVVGYEIPIAVDHFGHFMIEDCIKIAQALDEFDLAWYEDMVPWQLTEQYVRLKNSCKTPVLTGEDIFGHDGFKPLFEANAISMCHPDIATSGGLIETKKIGDLAQEHGISMAMHMAGSPVTLMASVHCAAATENFIVMEHHNVDDKWYDELVTLPEGPIVRDGYVTVPDTPGLGVELNEEVIKGFLEKDEKYFGPTKEWDKERSWDRLWSQRATGKVFPSA